MSSKVLGDDKSAKAYECFPSIWPCNAQIAVTQDMAISNNQCPHPLRLRRSHLRRIFRQLNTLKTVFRRTNSRISNYGLVHS